MPVTFYKCENRTSPLSMLSEPSAGVGQGNCVKGEGRRGGGRGKESEQEVEGG